MSEVMRAVRAHGEDDLRLESVPVPELGIGDVLVKVHACGFTPTELGWPSTSADRLGHPRLPATPGHEISGEVVAHGYGTARFAVGDEVFGITDWYRDGGLAEYVAVEARNLAPKPPELDHVAAAVLALGGLTAHQALFTHGHLQPGERVLITGAAGGVGHLAVQLAKLHGAYVIALDRPQRREELLALGADAVVEQPADLTVDLTGIDPPADGRFVTVVAPGERGIFFVVEAEPVVFTDLRPRAGATAPLSEAVDAIAAKLAHTTPGKLVITAAPA